jgi:hypothetical protein
MPDLFERGLPPDEVKVLAGLDWRKCDPGGTIDAEAELIRAVASHARSARR